VGVFFISLVSKLKPALDRCIQQVTQGLFFLEPDGFLLAEFQPKAAVQIAVAQGRDVGC
jgi:hypothetical protein